MNHSSFHQRPCGNRSLRFALITAVSALGFGFRIAAAQPAPPPDQPAPDPKQQPDAKHPPHPHPASVPLSGQVHSYNYGPHGNYDSMLLSKGDQIIQINFPPDTGSAIAQAAPVGLDVQLTATPEMGLPDHAIYNLVTLTSKGQTMTVGNKPEDARQTHVEGVIKQLNFGHHGEVNGAVLDTGDFIHAPGPEAASLNLTVGEKLSVDGRAVPMLTGHNAIDADTINGTALPHPSPPDGGPAAGPGHGGPRSPHPPRPDNADAPPPKPDAADVNQPPSKPPTP